MCLSCNHLQKIANTLEATLSKRYSVNVGSKCGYGFIFFTSVCCFACYSGSFGVKNVYSSLFNSVEDLCREIFLIPSPTMFSVLFIKYRAKPSVRDRWHRWTTNHRLQKIQAAEMDHQSQTREDTGREVRISNLGSLSVLMTPRGSLFSFLDDILMNFGEFFIPWVLTLVHYWSKPQIFDLVCIIST